MKEVLTRNIHCSVKCGRGAQQLQSSSFGFNGGLQTSIQGA